MELQEVFFKRVRYGFGTDRSGSSTDEKSGPSGSGFQYRYILGYCCCMSDDRTGTCHQYYENPAIDMGQITNGGVLTTLAFQQIPVLGPVILVVGIISFAYSTVLGWAYYGERCVEYLQVKKG